MLVCWFCSACQNKNFLTEFKLNWLQEIENSLSNEPGPESFARQHFDMTRFRNSPQTFCSLLHHPKRRRHRKKPRFFKNIISFYEELCLLKPSFCCNLSGFPIFFRPKSGFVPSVSRFVLWNFLKSTKTDDFLDAFEDFCRRFDSISGRGLFVFRFLPSRFTILFSITSTLKSEIL